MIKSAMSTRVYSGIYGGNWSYSFYGDNQGIAITERKDRKDPFLNTQGSGNGNSVFVRDNDRKTQEEFDLDDNYVRLKGIKEATDMEVARDNIVDEDDSNIERVRLDSPRPGIGQVLESHNKLKLNEPLQYRQKYSTHYQHQNALESQKVTNDQNSKNHQKTVHTHRNDKEDGSAFRDDKTKQEIEGFRRRLREKARQNKARQKEHAEQRQVLRDWVLEKSRNQERSRTKSASDLPRIRHFGSLEDIIEDERGNSGKFFFFL